MQITILLTVISLFLEEKYTILEQTKQDQN